jgi:CDGSH-type Zn-finger protein
MAPEKNKVRVTVSENGPYIVSGDIPLGKQTIAADAEGGSEAWQEGPGVAHRETYALWRCGASQAKPFCDGSHIKIGFDGAETAGRDAYLDQAKVLDGPILQLTDAESLCAFGRFCDPNGNVWTQVKQTDDPEIRSMFIRQVNECPSGRMVAWDKASGRTVEQALPVSISLIEDPERQCSGPLWRQGGIPIVAADGFEYEARNRVTLCRCGASKNKPFCDGTHATIEFRDSA